MLFASLILTSCSGGSIESDAKKIAELQCKEQELMKKTSSGDTNALSESNEIMVEAAALAKEMEGKYTSDSDKKKFGEAYLKALGDCN